MYPKLNINSPKTGQENILSLQPNTSAKEALQAKLTEKKFDFIINHKIGYYAFDFYFPDLKIAIQIEDTSQIESINIEKDVSKKLHILSMGIVVLRCSQNIIEKKTDTVFDFLSENASS